MAEVLVLRPGSAAWNELAAARADAAGGWVRFALTDAAARELGLSTGTVALGTIVSRYIGETEKNLAKLFAAVEQQDAILLFDEADALFGKRTEVGSAHDRYANLETAFLLSRLELAQAVPLAVRRNRQRFAWPADP